MQASKPANASSTNVVDVARVEVPDFRPLRARLIRTSLAHLKTLAEKHNKSGIELIPPTEVEELKAGIIGLITLRDMIDQLDRVAGAAKPAANKA